MSAGASGDTGGTQGIIAKNAGRRLSGKTPPGAPAAKKPTVSPPPPLLDVKPTATKGS